VLTSKEVEYFDVPESRETCSISEDVLEQAQLIRVYAIAVSHVGIEDYVSRLERSSNAKYPRALS
jgi:hypothetical protein